MGVECLFQEISAMGWALTIRTFHEDASVEVSGWFEHRNGDHAVFDSEVELPDDHPPMSLGQGLRWAKERIVLESTQ